ncbi:hypothetical protein [Brevibacillus nitrificans]|nr:hypothetical protein [Brevibacillus nitrificans]MDR7314731.1 hypothetical protein [Brevibacillus nitrificans]
MDWFIHDPEVDQAAHAIGGKMNTLILGGTTSMAVCTTYHPLNLARLLHCNV